MPTNYATYLKVLRKKRGFSQSDLASRLGISRPPYIAIEQGKREVTLAEAEKLSEIFGISLVEMKSGVFANYEKFKQMILAFIRHAAAALLTISFISQPVSLQTPSYSLFNTISRLW